jgi:uncharacterized protein (TIGR02996 family)
MSTRGGMDRAFLEAIREAPEDDAPRLVYADWLEEHDDPARAAFIRVQCELARFPGSERQAELEAQERKLLVANRAAWLGPLARGLPFGHCKFRRGFPEELTIRPKWMVKMVAELDARVPAGRVTLSGGFGDPAMKALADCPTLGWVAGLMYEHPQVTEAGLEMVGQSPNFTRLGELSVTFANFTLNGLLALTTSPYHTALRRFSLHRMSWQGKKVPDTAAAFAAAGVRLRLRSLALRGHELGPAGAAALAGTENLAGVKELDLLLNGIRDEGAAALARSPHLRNLASLVLQTNGLTSRSVRELAASPLLDGIRILNLAVNEIGDKGAEALAASPRLCALRELDLSSAAIGDRGAEALAASPRLANLTILEVSGNTLTDRGSQALFESPYLQQLKRISFDWQKRRKIAFGDRQRKQWKDRLGTGARV